MSDFILFFDFRKALDLPLTDSKIPRTQDVQLYNPQAAALAQIYQEPYNDLVRLILRAMGMVLQIIHSFFRDSN